MTLDTADLILQAIEHLRTDLATLRDEVREGFEKVNGRLGRLEGRVTNVEKWIGEHDAAERALGQQELLAHREREHTFSARQIAVATAAMIAGSIASSAAVFQYLSHV